MAEKRNPRRRPAARFSASTLHRAPALPGVLVARKFLTFMESARMEEQRRRRNRGWLSILAIGAVLAIASVAGLAWKERATAVSAGKAAEARERATEHLQQVLRSVDQIAADTDWDLAVLPDASGNLFTIRRACWKRRRRGFGMLMRKS